MKFSWFAASNEGGAWQPLTPLGVAAFARSSVWRLLVVQLVFALAAAAAAAWFLDTAWFPPIRQAIRHLPEHGDIRSGRLNWSGESPQLLSQNYFLALAVDLDHSGAVRPPAHVQVEFGRESVRFFSLLGYSDLPYPPDRIVAFNQPELEPWWGAWQAPILWITIGAVLAWCFVIWTLLAAIYCLPVWLVGFFANRQLTFRGSWKLAGAALMPGALVMIAAIVAYGLGFLDLVQLLAAAAAHFVIGWVYLFCAPFRVAKLPSSPKNPFS